ncbi:hypothetical protein HA402_002729 [Bradysia odoriphaga]|nr:hypothetical protein HA402_002729 [Bradysia odoriphaga]
MTSADIDEINKIFENIKSEKSVHIELSTKQKCIDLLKAVDAEDVLDEFIELFGDGDEDEVPDDTSQSFKIDFSLLFNKWNDFKISFALNVVPPGQALDRGQRDQQASLPAEPNSTSNATNPPSS